MGTKEQSRALTDEWGITDGPHIDWCVECWGCGKLVKASEAIIEEGDRWECEPCWEKLESKERVARHGLDFDVGEA